MDHVSHEAVERLAALILVVGGAIAVAASIRARSVHPGPAASVTFHASSAADADGGPPSVTRSLALILAGLSAGAAVIHLVAAPPHYAEIGDLAAGFVAAAIFQGVWVRWCLAGPGARAAWVGIAGNLGLVLAWAWTRTVGLPFGGPGTGPEAVGYPDGLAVVFELLLVGGLAARLIADRRPARDAGRPVRSGMRAVASIAIVPVVGLVLVLTSLATVAIAAGLEHGGPTDGHPAAEHIAAP